MTMKRLLLLSLSLCMVLSCGGRRTASAPATRTFPEVRPPAMLSGDEALQYMAVHFWDRYLDTTGRWLSDSAHIAGVDTLTVETQVGTYATLLGMVPIGEARKSTAALYARMEACQRADTTAQLFPRLTELISRYLYDPNSPVRLEDAYEPFVARLATSPFVPAARKAGYAFEARMCRLNAIGSPAADFVYQDLRGRRHRLYDTRAPYTLLFFTNPGCPNCRDIMDSLQQPFIADMVEKGTLAIVNVYIDEDIDAWRAYAPTYPRSWHTGFDPGMVIRSDILYHVRAIPSLYLLDEDKTVLLKDAPPEKVFAALGDWLPTQ